MANFGDFQLQIYLQGMLQGVTPEITTDLARLESQAAGKLPAEAMGYIVPSAGSGATARANQAAFERWRLVPRMLRGSTERDLSCTVLGTAMPAPVLVAPIGVQTLAHPDGELATAGAANTLGLTYTHSTQASHAIEQIEATSKWFQLYYPTDRDVCLSFLQRAKAAGYAVLVVTLDTGTIGWRPADLDRGFLPFLKGEGLANYFSDPAFRAKLAKPIEEDPGAAVMHWAQMFPNVGLSWDDLSFLRDNWDGPIVLKGITHVEDAKLAAEHGVDGLVVSNHGGRQVDGAIASLDALPAIADAVGEQLTILFDSGVRTGADAAKALALGAKAILLGRPLLYGLALAGQAGVEHVLRCFLAELDLTLALSGHANHRELNRDSVVRA
ncbi:isopentenyl diphosphate isomerase/L-lactate dehydrogenase-like FMN-dependent dehydrogenase [Kribbella pratensis]|uniref:Isopentenyl diphosphate isomerase/L-lactate dehydrogenase-like FMN-dependent dehydrogenase n=1 Tax=Kribbella pratensis TaxID=2512112 RepID=A0ABY2FCV0_9ACTN|nr:alpha-hydroxy-acid oxidizing protein [Kribbella pratensis]TDW88061.1 isopentenyl diphosphate isomerase/L-lactate dehydrogenase-like FMN-dependent dehydrogenase [Kribbella pratensis]